MNNFEVTEALCWLAVWIACLALVIKVTHRVVWWMAVR